MGMNVDGSAVGGNFSLPETTGTEQTQQTSSSGGFAELKDALESLKNLYEGYDNYNNDINEPKLPDPVENIVEQNVEELYDNTLVENLKQNVYQGAVKNALSQLKEGPPPLTDEQLTQVAFAATVRDTPVSDKIAQIVAQLDEMVLEELALEYGDPELFIPSAADHKKFKRSMQEAFSNKLEQKLNEAVAKGLISPTKAKQLLFAHHLPEAANAALQNELEQFEQQALQELKHFIGFPEGWKPESNTEGFLKGLSTDFTLAMEQAIDAFASANGLSKGQTQTLKFMHFHPETNFDGKAQLLGTFNQVESQVLEGLQKELGLPNGWAPKAFTALFDGIAKGNYRINFNTMLNEYASNEFPPLSMTDKMMIKFALDNPNALGIPSDIKEIAQQLSTEAWGKVSEEFGIPPGGAPPSGPVNGGAVDEKAAVIFDKGVQYYEQMLSTGLEIVNTLSGGPEKGLLLNYLKSISDALSKMKEFLFALEATDAEVGKMLTRSKLADKLDQLEAERAEMERMREKMEKLGPLMNFMKIFEPFGDFGKALVMGLMANIMFGPLGPIVAAVAAQATQAASFLHDVSTQKQDSLLNKTMEAVSEAIVSALGDAVDEETKKALKGFIKMMMTAVVSVTAGAAGAMGGPMTAVMGVAAVLPTMLAESKAVEDIAEGAGRDKDEVQTISMATNMAVAGALMLATLPFMLQSMGTSLSNVGNSLKGLGQGLTQTASEVAKGVSLTARQFADSLKGFAGMVGEMAKGAVGRIKSVLKAIQQLFLAISKGVRNNGNLAQTLGDIADTPKDLEKITSSLDDVLVYMEIGSMGFEATNSVVGAVVAFEKADIAMIEGEMEAMKEAIRAMIKIMQKVVDTLLSGLSEIGEDAANITKMLEEIYSGLSQSSTRLTQAI